MVDHSSLNSVKHFVDFAAKELNLTSLPPMDFDDQETDTKKTFGIFNTKNSKIKVRVKGRHPIDIMRTIAHELTHFKQKITHEKAGDGKKEDEANASAGRVMRKYDEKHGPIFKSHAISEDGVAAMATNTVGGVAGTGDIRQPPDQREPGVRRKKLRDVVPMSLFKRKPV